MTDPLRFWNRTTVLAVVFLVAVTAVPIYVLFNIVDSERTERERVCQVGLRTRTTLRDSVDFATSHALCSKYVR